MLLIKPKNRGVAAIPRPYTAKGFLNIEDN